MLTIQFASTVENGVIHVPQQYIGKLPAKVKVTLAPADERPRFKPKTKERPESIEEFSALKLDTRGWKFNREEANERR